MLTTSLQALRMLKGTVSYIAPSLTKLFNLILYKTIQSPEDYLVVQYDINAVLEWTTANYLAFNYWKCCHQISSFHEKDLLPFQLLH